MIHAADRRFSRLLLSVTALLAAATTAEAQAVPAEVGSPLYQGFQIPKLAGTLRYSLSASERLTFDYDGTDETANGGSVAGDLAFSTPSKRFPTAVIFAGGYQFNDTGQPSSYFQNMNITQTIKLKHLTFSATDSLGYYPDSPSTGLSGVPGVGDIGVGTVDTTQGVLSPYATRIDNTSSGTLTRELTGKTSLTGSGSYDLLRFVGDSNGIQTDTLGGGGGLTHRIDTRTNTFARYQYSEFYYIGNSGGFSTQGGSFGLTRQVTRRLSVNLEGGPEFISGSSLTGRGPSFTYTANASATYTGSVEHGASYSAGFVRSTNSGSGITYGANTSTVQGSASRSLGRSLTVSASVSYSQSASLQLITDLALNTNSVIGSFQANRALTRTVSAYVSYSALQQSYSGTAQALTPFNGLSQILGFGVTYSPQALELGRH